MGEVRGPYKEIAEQVREKREAGRRLEDLRRLRVKLMEAERDASEIGRLVCRCGVPSVGELVVHIQAARLDVETHIMRESDYGKR